MSPGQGVQKPSGDSPSAGLRGWAGRAGAENNSFWREWGLGGRWLEDHWTEQRICQNKVIVSGQNSRRIHSSAAVRLWPHLRITHPPPHREGGMEGGPGSSTRGHAPVPPRLTGAYMACMDIVSHANPAHQAGILTPSLVLPREPRQGHTHSYSCFYVTRPHTTIPKANNQQKVSDYLLCSGSCPPEILGLVMEIKLL